MAEKQYWLAKNDEPTARIELHNAKPKLNPSGEMNGQTFVTYIQVDVDIVKPGHAVMVGISTIGEAVDCRPKPVDELWVESNHSGSIRAYYGSDAGWIQGTFIPVSSLPGFQPNHRCRIAWDESGIRLIGTPEPI